MSGLRFMTAATIPAPLALARDAMDGYGRQWFLCGGWAADAWSGRTTRSHADVDIAVMQDDQRVLFEHLSGWKMLAHDNNVAEDCPDQWDGRRLDIPGHIHANSGCMPGVELDIQINEIADGDWILNHEPRITRPLDRCISRCAWGLPVVTPELVLFYKAYPPAWRDSQRPRRRRHDDHDLRTLLPILDEEQRSWLRHAILLVAPAHDWPAVLGAIA